jgi:hypothetical protein
VAGALGVGVDQLVGDTADAPAVPVLGDGMGNREALELVRYYARISAALRRRLLELVRSLGNQGSGEDGER